jgi:hypothetical protein
MSDVGQSPEEASPDKVDYDLTKISASPDPYGEVDRIYSELLHDREPSKLRLQVLDDQRGLLAAIGYGAYEPNDFNRQRRETSVRIALGIIDHNKEHVSGYREEEESWTRILNPMFNELVRHETSLGAADAKQLAACNMAEVLKKNIQSKGEHGDKSIQGTRTQDPEAEK